ncbi:unnamed protein product [Mortierella alpina]
MASHDGQTPNLEVPPGQAPNLEVPPGHLELSEATLRRITEHVTRAMSAANQPTSQATSSMTAQDQARLVRNDEARTLATVLKPSKPKPYTGAIDADACLNFIDNQAEYFAIVDLHPDSWVKYTAVNLESEAKAWWRLSGLKLDAKWKDFEAAFTAYHTPPNAVAAARQELNNLRQKGLSVNEYTHSFRRLLRLIPAMDAQTALYIYTTGLEPETSKEVRLRQPETMDQAVHQAAIVHAILHPQGPPAKPNPALAAPATTTDMEVDSLTTVIHHIERLVQTLGQNSTFVANTRRPLPKLTPQEKARLMKIGGCFKCHLRGHIAANCKNPAYASCNVHSVEMETRDDDAGKA